MTPEVKKALWKQYPEIWALYETYYDTHLEDNASWARLVEEAEAACKKYGREAVGSILVETVREIEQLARKKRGQCMIEIVNKGSLEGQLDELRRYCSRCRNQGGNSCRYCALGEEKKIYWEEGHGKAMEGNDQA